MGKGIEIQEFGEIRKLIEESQAVAIESSLFDKVHVFAIMRERGTVIWNVYRLRSFVEVEVGNNDLI